MGRGAAGGRRPGRATGGPSGRAGRPVAPGLVEVFANGVNHAPSRMITPEYELTTK